MREREKNQPQNDSGHELTPPSAAVQRSRVALAMRSFDACFFRFSMREGLSACVVRLSLPHVCLTTTKERRRRATLLLRQQHDWLCGYYRPPLAYPCIIELWRRDSCVSNARRIAQMYVCVAAQRWFKERSARACVQKEKERKQRRMVDCKCVCVERERACAQRIEKRKRSGLPWRKRTKTGAASFRAARKHESDQHIKWVRCFSDRFAGTRGSAFVLS